MQSFVKKKREEEEEEEEEEDYVSIAQLKNLLIYIS